MKVLGFMPLHYGKEYLKESLLSIKEHCDKVVIAYSKNPSQGYGTNLTCPDSEEDMLNIANEILGYKLIWHYASGYSQEFQHRAVKYQYSANYDLLLSIDADEVFEGLDEALKYAYENKERYYGIKGYINFWRSFDYACYDGFRPIRIENTKAFNSEQNIECQMKVYHFSTCQREEIMRYKYNVFGHASEVRKEWLDKTYYGWTPENNFGDLHCVSLNLWNAVPFDKTTLPESLKQHANFDKYLI